MNQFLTVGQRKKNQFKELFSVVETLAGGFELHQLTERYCSGEADTCQGEMDFAC